MAKKEKDKEKNKNKTKKKAAAASEMPLAPGPRGTAGGGGDEPASDMRRIAREAAWARMFGKNGSKNPFAGRA